MKKVISVVCAAICATAMLLTSCGSKAAYKDGTYTARFSTADSHGWTEYVTLTVEDGKITNAEYDALNEDGNKKTEDEAYKEAWVGTGSEVYPEIIAKKLGEDMVAKQDANKVDTVAGATLSSDSFRLLARNLEKSMKKGDTAEVLVDQPTK